MQRPDRYDVYKQGILLSTPTNQTTERKLFNDSLRADVKKGEGFIVRKGGTKSKSQREREMREATNYENRQRHVQRRLENHLYTRPKREDLIQRNVIPSFVDADGREFYVFNGDDISSPGKPLGVKGRRKTAQKFEEVGAVINVHLQRTQMKMES